MVTVRENAIRLEVGISYQWAVDAQQAVVSRAKALRSAILAKAQQVKRLTVDAVRSAERSAVSANRAARDFAHETPGRVRDSIAARLLGMSVSQLAALRQLAVDGPAVGAVGTNAKRTATRSKVAAVALEVPAEGVAVDVKQFRSALDQVAQAVYGKSSLPILGHVLLEAEHGKLWLSTTDLEVGVRVSVPAALKSFGRVTVPCALLRSALKSAKGAINLRNHANDRVMLQAENLVTVLDGLDADEFPILQDVKHTGMVSWPQFGDMLKSIAAAVGVDESLAILTGVMIDAENICSTDTHRLHVIKHGMDLSGIIPAARSLGTSVDGEELFGQRAVIIPGRVCNMLLKALDCKGAAVSVGFSESQAIFQLGDAVLISRLIEGQFPNCEKVIPDPDVYTCEVIADKEAMLSALSQVATVAAENSNRVLICGGANGKLAIRASSGHAGDTQAVVDAEQDCRWADGLMTALSCKYLTEALQFVGGDRVRLRSTGVLNQFRIESEADSRLAVVMPMQF